MTTLDYDGYRRSVPRRASPFELFFLYAFLFSFTFDFRAEAGGHWVQWIFLAVSMLSFCILCMLLIKRRRNNSIYFIRFFPLIFGTILIIHSTFGSMYNGVPFGNFARLELSYYLFFQSIIIVYLLARAGIDITSLMKPIFMFSLVMVFWRIYHTIWIEEIDLPYVRYRIAPPVLIFILGISIGGLYLRNLNFMFPAIFALMVINLSSTRSYLMCLAAIFIMIQIISIIGRRKTELIYLFIVDIILISVLLYLYSSGYFENWILRFVHNETVAGDATLLTRLAEYKSQMDILLSNNNKLIIGSGLGSNYDRDLSIVKAAIFSGKIALEDFDTFSFGHSLWIYSFFSGGLSGGWILPLIVIGFFVKTFRNIVDSYRINDLHQFKIDLQCNFIAVQIIVYGLVAHPFNERLFCIYFGIIFAISFIRPYYLLYPTRDTDRGSRLEPRTLLT